jgi:hypothetical protein
MPEGASPTATLPAGTGQTPRRSRAGTALVGAGTALVPEMGSRPEDFCPERLNVGGCNGVPAGQRERSTMRELHSLR